MIVDPNATSAHPNGLYPSWYRQFALKIVCDVLDCWCHGIHLAFALQRFPGGNRSSAQQVYSTSCV